MNASLRSVGMAAALTLVLPMAAARAQTLGTGAIAGAIRDGSGAVLPGVTVEAASPALIEKIRTVVSDDQGLYRIVDLRPGTYTVTFTLTGFSAVRREGIELTASFTALVNADLRVGGIEETITVTGDTPLVDVQNVIQQKVFSREVLDALPVGKSVQAYAPLIPGATVGAAAQDVGGITQGSSAFTIHGGTGDLRPQQAGISFHNPLSAGGNLLYAINRASVQEVTIELGGVGAESETGGVQLNVIPKDGGNTFSAYFATDYTNGGLQNGNLTDQLRARGLGTPNALKKAYDLSTGVGGPLKKDRLWFYSAHRWVGAQLWTPSYYNLIPDTLFYQPDLSRQAFENRPYQNSNIRLTWQITSKQKLSGTFENQYHNCNCTRGAAANRAPEASADHEYNPNWLTLVTWSYPATQRVLFEAAGATYYAGTNQTPIAGVAATDIAIEELSTNFFYRSRGTGLIEGSSYARKRAAKHTQRFSVAYITGSHAFKTGVMVEEIFNQHTHTLIGDTTYRFRSGVPSQLALWATPWDHRERIVPILGTFVQDQWTLKNLTFNLGARFDYLNGTIPEQHIPAGSWVPARDFEPVRNVPNWKDVSPRLGVAYNVFGNGKTALKVSVGRYVVGNGTDGLASANNPANRMVGGATRSWTDDNRDFIPQEPELGPLSDTRFGQVVSNTSYADDVLAGVGARAYTWQSSASLQQEIGRRLSVNAGYFRTTYGNFLAADNLLVTAADYDPYCIAAPLDSRLPGGGGYQVCGLYDIKPTRFGDVENLVTQASNYGKQTRIFNGVDLTLNAKFGPGKLLAGGLSMGKTETDNCEVGNPVAVGDLNYAFIDSPQRQFCHVSPPWAAETQVKFYGAYPLPWNLHASATLQNLPGVPVLASYVVTSAQASPSLGRGLSGGANATAIVDLIEPGRLYEERTTQLDVRLTKIVSLGRTRIQGMLDIYNVFNENSILGINTRFGPSWLNVQQILAGRLFKFGAQLDF